MIDWISVGFGTLWILGLGFVFAALSYANYLSGQQKLRFGQALEKISCRIMIYLGFVFFCLGCAGAASAIWIRLLWVALASIFALQIWQIRKIKNT